MGTTQLSAQDKNLHFHLFSKKLIWISIERSVDIG